MEINCASGCYGNVNVCVSMFEETNTHTDIYIYIYICIYIYIREWPVARWNGEM